METKERCTSNLKSDSALLGTRCHETPDPADAVTVVQDRLKGRRPIMEGGKELTGATAYIEDTLPLPER